jgi:FixJ family two-component response regulator
MMPPLTSAMIAVVDDDPRVLESLENLLQSVGYGVRGFSSAPALLENAGLAHIDCLITDVGLSGMSGFELQQIALAERPDLPVILITARHPANHPLADQANNWGIFQKPFDVEELLTAVSDALLRSSSVD